MLDSPSSISDLSVKSTTYNFLDMVYVLRSKNGMINWTLDTIESNPNMTIQELADLIDYRIEGNEREIDNAETRDELDWVFNELTILEWIRSTVRTVGQLMMF